MKNKKRFICKECGNVSINWIGKCPECSSWNSFIEEIIEDPKKGVILQDLPLVRVDNIELKNEKLYKTEKDELNNFFGNGIVAGSVALITGEPGVGKSTFLLYLAKALSKELKIFYFSGEESQTQLKRRCDRVDAVDLNLFISNQMEAEGIIEVCKKDKPDVIFIDSIQTVYSSNTDSMSGTISQIKNSSYLLIQFAKKFSIPIFLIGHITKSGDIAGPKILEHMVDVVINFESEFKFQYRILRAIKNRYGSIDEIIIFEMRENGLLLIDNPSSFFIDKNSNEEIIGKCRSVIIEGRQPIIVEVEALAVPSIYPSPRRFAEGVESARVSRIAAIIDKHLNENLNNYDIYFNISGGVKTKDVGIDLAIAAAIYSSKNKKKIKSNIFFIGELSLTGLIGSVYRLDARVKEAERFGSDLVLVPENNILKDPDKKYCMNNISSVIDFMLSHE